jgi:hypothetical protein
MSDGNIPPLRKGDGADAEVCITRQHAQSLAKMVLWFRQMVQACEMPEGDMRSDMLTTGYCDELLEDLAK